MQRVILLGASNLTYGFPMLVESLRASWPAAVQVFAAHGHGRSYGNWSRVLGRRLPGIRQCGLWESLAEQPVPRTQPLALLTDVGNDLLYGRDPATILSWVDDCLGRLGELNAAVALTGLPLDSVKRLSRLRYHATRACFFPGRGPDWPTMQQMLDELDGGLRTLATARGATFIEPRGAWYGFDPIHVRRPQQVPAWREILSGWPVEPPVVSRPGFGQTWRLWRLRPAHRILNGREQTTLQPALATDGLEVRLY